MSRIQFSLHFFGILATLINAGSSKILDAEVIQGGDDANIEDFPYQVSLQMSGKPVCGGSILNERFILTAAHCVIDENNSFRRKPLKVVAGIEYLKTIFDEKITADVVEVYVPREYNSSSRKRRIGAAGDIALLKLKEPFDLDHPRLGTVELPETNNTYEGVKAVVTGFGYNSIDLVTDPSTGRLVEVNGKNSYIMRYAEVMVISQKKCAKHNVTKKHLCGAVIQRDKDQPEGLCSGDSGGPLVHFGVQIGVVSASPLGCREDSLPALYTRVSEYIDFINKVVDGRIDRSIRSTTL